MAFYNYKVNIIQLSQSGCRTQGIGLSGQRRLRQVRFGPQQHEGRSPHLCLQGFRKFTISIPNPEQTFNPRPQTSLGASQVPRSRAVSPQTLHVLHLCEDITHRDQC